MQRVQHEACAFIQMCHETLTAQKITNSSLAFFSSDKGAVPPSFPSLETTEIPQDITLSQDGIIAVPIK